MIGPLHGLRFTAEGLLVNPGLGFGHLTLWTLGFDLRSPGLQNSFNNKSRPIYHGFLWTKSGAQDVSRLRSLGLGRRNTAQWKP